MTFPTEQPPVPDLVARLAAGRSVIAVWRNELGGNTFRIGSGDEYVKMCPSDLAAEAARLNWTRRFIAVPEVLGVGPGWLHTAGLNARSAVDPYWAARPETAARAIGAGLRALHTALPVRHCPFGPPSWIPAVASMSLAWNYGSGGHEDALFDAYGVAPEPERIAYYRQRWEEEPPPAR